MDILMSTRDKELQNVLIQIVRLSWLVTQADTLAQKQAHLTAIEQAVNVARGIVVCEEVGV
jgi:hypothetical protein